MRGYLRASAWLQSHLTFWALWLVFFAGGCGSGDDERVEGPLPTDADSARAYTEGFMAENPEALLQPTHLAIVRLEPMDSGVIDTCPQHAGVDCLPYYFARETVLELTLDEDPELLAHRLVLRQADGAVVLDLAAGDEPGNVVVAPGEYRLDLHHVFAGDAEAAEQTVFLAPEPADEVDADPAAVAGVDTGQGGTAAAPPTARLRAQKDCIRCDFSKAKMKDLDFSRLALTGSTFDGAEMWRVSFREAKMESALLRRLTVPQNPDQEVPYSADFSGAVLTGAAFSFHVLLAIGDKFVGVFRGAMLDSTTWELADTDENSCSDHNFCAILAPDFRNANLRGSRFSAIRFPFPTSNPPVECTFQGADLTAADFRPKTPVRRLSLANCRFDREPESNRVTVLRGAHLGGAHLGRANLSEADLSGAILEGADFGSGFIDNPQPNDGTNLSRANLSGAKIAGARFTSANLSQAAIAGISPASFNGFDLRFTNFSGVDFTGIDLSQTDLSQAVLSAGALTANFTGAKLSDGRRGVTLAGVRFPPRYAGLKGTNMTGADLRNVTLFQANLEGVTLENARLVGANLNFANLRRAKLGGASLGVTPGSEGEGVAASLRGVFMTDVDLTDADLRSVDLTEAHLYGAEGQSKLLRTRLDSANLSGAVCAEARFSGTMANAVFNGAQLANAVFNGATLTGARFDNAYLHGADFSSAISVSGVSLSNAAISAQPGTWPFMEQDGTPFIFQFGATKLGALATSSRVTCPNGDSGPCCPGADLQSCLGAKLKPVRNGPNPPVPPCVPSPQYCYENCLNPPNFNHRPPCR